MYPKVLREPKKMPWSRRVQHFKAAAWYAMPVIGLILMFAVAELVKTIAHYAGTAAGRASVTRGR